MGQILSEEEIELLLKGISEVTQNPNPLNEEDIMEFPFHEDEALPYDLSTQKRISRSRLPSLEYIYSQFARQFRQTLTIHLRRPIGVMLRSTEIIKLRSFLETVNYPTSFNIFHMSPLRGRALIVLEQRLVHTFIDMIFGGSGIFETEVPVRDFTNIEQKMIGKLINSTLEDMEAAWKPVIPLHFRYSRSESNPQFVNIANEDEVMLLTTFNIDIWHSPMTLSICIPYNMLDPIRSRLNSGYNNDPTHFNQFIAKQLTECVLQTPVQLKVKLGEAKMTLRKFLNLKVGDYLQLDQHSHLPLNIFVENVIKFQGFQGSYKGKKAIQIHQLLHEPRPEEDWFDSLDPSILD